MSRGNLEGNFLGVWGVAGGFPSTTGVAALRISLERKKKEKGNSQGEKVEATMGKSSPLNQSATNTRGRTNKKKEKGKNTQLRGGEQSVHVI